MPRPKTLAAGLACALTALLAGSGPAQAAFGTGSPFGLSAACSAGSETCPTAQTGGMTMDDAGRAFTVWERSAGDFNVIEGRTLTAAKTLGPVQTIAPAPALGVQSAPLPSGATLVMWISAPWDDRILRARVRAANGTLGATETIASGIGSFVVATNASGQAIIAWDAWDGTGSPVSAQLRSASGVLSPVRRLSGYNIVDFAAAIGPAGDATVAWARIESRDVRVAAARLSADGAAGVSTVLTATGAKAYEPAVAMDAAGRAHVAYVRGGQLMLRTRSASGGYGAARPLAPAGTYATSPRLAAGSDGQVEIAWMRVLGEDTGDVLARTLNADSSLTATQTIGPGLIEQTSGTTVGLVAGSQGRSVVVWTSTESGKPTVELRRRTSTTLAAPERLRLTPQRVFRPLVATNADGQVAAAWTEGVAATDTQSSYDRVLGRTSGP